MPFKRKESPYFQIRKYNLPGYGDTGALSTKTTNREVAIRMESMLVDIANNALIDSTWYALLNGICKHEIDLATVLRAKNQGRLDDYRMSLTDPLIADIAKQLRGSRPIDSAVSLGLKRVTEFMGSSRMSTLTTESVTAMIYQYMEVHGVKQNTARQKIKRASAALLEFYYGHAKRDAVIKAVKVKSQDDTREVRISPADIAKVLQACHDLGRVEIAVLVQVALITSADKGVLLHGKERGKVYRGVLKRDITIEQDAGTSLIDGTVILHDKKTSHRTRTVRLPHSICQQLLVMCSGKNPNDPVFKVKYQSFKDVWNKIRKKAGLWDEENGYAFTLKDLRAQTAIYAEQVGIEQSKIQKTLGHSNETMTRRYQRTKAAMSQDDIEKMNEAMFGGSTNRNPNTRKAQGQ